MLTDQQLDEAMTDALRALDIDWFEELAAEAERRQTNRRRRLARPDALLDAALWYAHKDIAVFPVQPRGKAPITRHGFKDASTDIDIIRRWWTTTPNANIGAPTGHRFDVIDIDGPEGFRSLGEMRARGILPDHIGRTSTPGDPPWRPPGMHYLITPTGDGNSTRIRPGIDYRGVGGYVVLPPSIGPNGDRYEWLNPPQVRR